MRLQHFLARSGVGSRRQCEKIIAAGRVCVNGQVVSRLGTKIDPEHDDVTLDGKCVRVEKKFYVLLNKPRGYLSSVVDKRGSPTVSELVSALPARLYPVGRLDRDTEGLLLMTNDGDFCYRVTHPRFEVKKTYRAEVRGKPSQRALHRLRTGVEIGTGKTHPATVKLVRSDHRKSILDIAIHEGRKRQVRLMCKAVGHPVIRLTRIEFGGVRLGSIKPGHYRFLLESEVESLMRIAEGDPKQDL